MVDAVGLGSGKVSIGFSGLELVQGEPTSDGAGAVMARSVRLPGPPPGTGR